MVGKEVNVHATMHGFTVDREREPRHRAVNMNIKKRKEGIRFPLNFEMDRRSQIVKRGEERLEKIKVMRP
jgi:hypothetical protein